MKQQTDFSEVLCGDEAVCFIAERHHVTPQQLLHSFLFGEVSTEVDVPAETAILLEPNEIEILKGLSEAITCSGRRYRSKRKNKWAARSSRRNYRRNQIMLDGSIIYGLHR